MEQHVCIDLEREVAFLPCPLDCPIEAINRAMIVISARPIRSTEKGIRHEYEVNPLRPQPTEFIRFPPIR